MAFAWPRALTPVWPLSRVLVYFGAPQPDGALAWTPAPAPISAPSAPPEKQPIAALIVGVVALVFSCVGLFIWRDSFIDVYVVDVDRTATLRVHIDGADVGAVAGADGSGKDVAFRKFEVRRGEAHVVESIDGNGRATSVRLGGADDASYGWIVAPGLDEKQLCFVAQTVHYSNFVPSPPELQRFELTNGAASLGGRPDFIFVDPPRSITLSQNESERSLWGVRATACRNLASAAQ
ncbi:MAG TPA: hypothetical protein VIF62_17555 [Labilithrix sp.]